MFPVYFHFARTVQEPKPEALDSVLSEIGSVEGLKSSLILKWGTSGTSPLAFLRPVNGVSLMGSGNTVMIGTPIPVF
jgi:hypothetical protein